MLNIVSIPLSGRWFERHRVLAEIIVVVAPRVELVVQPPLQVVEQAGYLHVCITFLIRKPFSNSSTTDSGGRVIAQFGLVDTLSSRIGLDAEARILGRRSGFAPLQPLIASSSSRVERVVFVTAATAILSQQLPNIQLAELCLFGVQLLVLGSIALVYGIVLINHTVHLHVSLLYISRVQIPTIIAFVTAPF